MHWETQEIVVHPPAPAVAPVLKLQLSRPWKCHCKMGQPCSVWDVRMSPCVHFLTGKAAPLPAETELPQTTSLHCFSLCQGLPQNKVSGGFQGGEWRFPEGHKIQAIISSMIMQPFIRCWCPQLAP